MTDYRPETVEVVRLHDAAALLGMSVEGARQALRRADIHSGYPRELVVWLARNRPRPGARTDTRRTDDAET